MEQGDPNIVVTESAVVKLAEHLQAVGRMRGSIGDVRRTLNHAVIKSWTKAQSYRDEKGPVWVIDVSESFDDQMLYAVVRPSLGGNRSVQAVVEVDEVESFVQTRQWQTPEAMGEFGEEMASVEPNRSLSKPVNTASTEAPTDPCLVVWWQVADLSDRDKGDFSNEQSVRCERAEVPSQISRLLQEGVEEKNIEIWTKVSKPKVQIAF
jgi:hypothetical protein